MSKIENLKKSMATKEDILKIEIKIEHTTNTMIKWVIGVNSATIGLIFALLKFIR